MSPMLSLSVVFGPAWLMNSVMPPVAGAWREDIDVMGGAMALATEALASAHVDPFGFTWCMMLRKKLSQLPIPNLLATEISILHRLKTRLHSKAILARIAFLSP